MSEVHLKPQADDVLEHMLRHGSITQREADRWLGVGRLSARILELREAGFIIRTERVKVKTRRGTAYVARYTREPMKKEES